MVTQSNKYLFSRRNHLCEVITFKPLRFVSADSIQFVNVQQQ